MLVSVAIASVLIHFNRLSELSNKLVLVTTSAEGRECESVWATAGATQFVKGVDLHL